MNGNGKEHLGTFAQQRVEQKALKKKLNEYQQRLEGRRADPYANTPPTTRYEITQAIRDRAEELVAAESIKPPRARKSYQQILKELLTGTIV